MSEPVSIRINGKDYAANQAVLEFLASHSEDLGLSVEETGDWKSAILVRDALFGISLVSAISNLLYNEPYAKDRERRFLEEGGEFAARITAAAIAETQKCQRHPLFPRLGKAA